MASVPSKGDRFLAKVDLTVYMDRECKNQYPILPPGPQGLRKSVQYPGRRATGEEVGTFTGSFSDAAYEVDFTVKYERASPPSGLFDKWDYAKITSLEKLWVKRDQVTGFWDTGVDAPKVDEKTPPPPVDNTNTFLGLAIVGAGIFKFSRRNRNK